MAALTVEDATEGYDCDFIDTVPDSLSCCLCLLPLRDPHLLDCCGVKMCAPCISRIETAGQPCPHCRERFVLHMLDKGTARQVLSLKTRCSRKRRYNDCEWEGELRHLRRHVEDECGRTLVECRYSCGESIPRRQLVVHEEQCENSALNIKKRFDLLRALAEERYKREMRDLEEKITKQEKTMAGILAKQEVICYSILHVLQ